MIAKKGSKTMLPRCLTKSIKNILKTVKLTENASSRRALAIR